MCHRSANGEDAPREHPVAATVLTALAGDEGAKRPSEIRAELPDDPALATVAYHLKRLESEGAIKRDGTRFKFPRRRRRR